MDGYAIDTDEFRQELLSVNATSAAGQRPPTWTPGTAVKIFTGATVPTGANCVVKREDCTETPGSVFINLEPGQLQVGANIRFQGENSDEGAELIPSGTLLSPASIATIASFAPREIKVRRKVRVAVLNTGDELVPPGEPVQPWQIRDSNGPVLESFLQQLPYAELTIRHHVADNLSDTQKALASALAENDAVILTGGVSMGDADYVPAATEGVGATISFHRLPIRPGKPILGAHLNGKLILGLPGNPVSVAVTSKVFAEPLLRQLAGISLPVSSQKPVSQQPMVDVDDHGKKRLHLHWYRLVERTEIPNQVRYVKTKGSGDVVSLASSIGFVALPPNSDGSGSFPLFSW